MIPGKRSLFVFPHACSDAQYECLQNLSALGLEAFVDVMGCCMFAYQEQKETTTVVENHFVALFVKTS